MLASEISLPGTLKVHRSMTSGIEVPAYLSSILKIQNTEIPQLTITINTDLSTSLLPVLDDRRGRVDNCAVHIEEQGGKVDDLSRGGEVVFFVVRHLERG